nr:MAG TPA: hypothetical protein [Caudoviricetes sp.]
MNSKVLFLVIMYLRRKIKLMKLCRILKIMCGL